MEGADHIDPENTAAVRAHKLAVQASESVKQAAIAAATTQAAATAAIITHLRNCLASAKTNNLTALQGFYQSALRENGVNS